MRTVILTSTEKLADNMGLLKENLAKQDNLYVFTDTGMIPVTCVRELSSLPCKVEFFMVLPEELPLALHLAIGIASKWAQDGIYVVGMDKVYIPEGFAIPKIHQGISCDILKSKSATNPAAKRTSKKKEPGDGSPSVAGKAPVTSGKTEAEGTDARGQAADKTDESVVEGSVSSDGMEAEEEKKDITKFTNLLYAYCGRNADIHGREEEIAQAVDECMSDVSLDMMLRMRVSPGIPGLYDAILPHYKELKAALG